MWATEGHPEHEGITGVTFDSDGHRLVGTFYLARGDGPKPPGRRARAEPGAGRARVHPVPHHHAGEFAAQRDEAAARMDALDAVAAISPRPLLIVHGTEDRWVPASQARELRARAGPPCRYVEVDGANHAFSWHRAALRDLIAGRLDQACDPAGRLDEACDPAGRLDEACDPAVRNETG